MKTTRVLLVPALLFAVAAQGAAQESAPAARGVSLPMSPELSIQGNILDIEVEKPPPPPPPPAAPVTAAPPPPPPPPKPPEKIPFKLLGTLAGGPVTSIAFLEKDGKQEAVRIGTTWEQATVVKVERNKASIRWKGRDADLAVDFKDWGGPSAPQIASTAQRGEPGEPPPAPVFTAQGEVPVPESIETRKVPRGQVDKELQNLAGLLGSMRVQPYYESGQPSGFLMTNVRPGSFVDQVGVQNGDILRFVNGQKIDNVQNAFQLYNIFKNSTNVEVTVIRDTRPVTLKYVIE